MGVALLDLVETALRVAKQALGNRAGKPDPGGLAREAHRKRRGIAPAQPITYKSTFGLRPRCFCRRTAYRPA